MDRYFKEYKRVNCEMEWFMDKAFEHCACLPFFCPEVKDRPICQFTDIPCLITNYGKKLFYSPQFVFNFVLTDILDEIHSEEGKDEACPTQCNQMMFKMTTNSVTFQAGKNLTFDNF